jgi:hypothetical protein
MNRRFLQLITLSLLLLVFMISACSSGSASSPVVDTRLSSTPTPEPLFKVDEPVAVGTTWVITVTHVSLSSGDSSYTPPKGKQLFLIAISEQNRSSQVASVNGAVNWSLQDSTGTSFQVVHSAYGEMPVENVEAGATSTGELVYEVPTSVGHLTLTFAPASGDGPKIWDISA